MYNKEINKDYVVKSVIEAYYKADSRFFTIKRHKKFRVLETANGCIEVIAFQFQMLQNNKAITHLTLDDDVFIYVTPGEFLDCQGFFLLVDGDGKYIASSLDTEGMYYQMWLRNNFGELACENCVMINDAGNTKSARTVYSDQKSLSMCLIQYKELMVFDDKITRIVEAYKKPMDDFLLNPKEDLKIAN